MVWVATRSDKPAAGLDAAGISGKILRANNGATLNDDRIVSYRHSPNLPLSFAELPRLDAEALDQFVESNERPTILLPGPRPSFALCDFLRAAPAGLPRAIRVQRAVEWIARHGRPLSAWKSWTVEMPPAESDYDEPVRVSTPSAT